MTPRTIQPPDLGPGKGYSPGVQARGFVFVAGQIGAEATDDGDLEVIPGGLVPQFKKALENVRAVLKEAGAGPEDVVDMTVYTTRVDTYRAKLDELGEAWRNTMGKRYPAMALVGVDELFDPEALVEVKATAVTPDHDTEENP